MKWTHTLEIRFSSSLIPEAGSAQEALMCQAAQLEGGDELIAVRDVEGDNGNDKQSGVVGTTSSDNIDSIRVEEAQCAERPYEDIGS
ncbi:hypothetical protein SCLCIDRAFT_1223024 [Scleroderma citrinum Foug A]|uniref:Uncharacterized protein n=1 Tax=Scleroderma citrinum Foug A TaxID=1036808 RepID=A0A0C3DAT4_9AGAM|nr:hypothetical protein SCLCIDRAFT_1223024 [Scleroderma citrinum Foug A]